MNEVLITHLLFELRNNYWVKIKFKKLLYKLKKNKKLIKPKTLGKQFRSLMRKPDGGKKKKQKQKTINKKLTLWSV